MWRQLDPYSLKFHTGVAFEYGALNYYSGSAWRLIAPAGNLAKILYSNESYPSIYGPILGITITANRTIYGGAGVYGGSGNNGITYVGSYAPMIAKGGAGSDPYGAYVGGAGAIGGGGSGGMYSYNPYRASGAGGGCVIIDADEVRNANISAKGADGAGDYFVESFVGAGGGGTINIFTKKWAGTATLSVAGGYTPNPYYSAAQSGGIVLWRKNDNGTFTLMSGVEQGVAITQSRLNELHGVPSGAPAPVNGTNFTIAF